jgi:hypothetical protein
MSKKEEYTADEKNDLLIATLSAIRDSLDELISYIDDVVEEVE